MKAVFWNLFTLIALTLMGATLARTQICTNGEVRLIFGASETEGTVEVCVNNLWGTICDTFWDNREAKVVCQQLGFLSYGSAQFNAYYGRGSGPIWLDSLWCIGTESSLLQCPRIGIGVAAYYCDHSDDAGVRCFVRRNSNCSDGEIRLRDGSNEREGRVEICIEETWGTICDNSWDSRDADVVCSQLGFPTLGAIPFLNSYFGSGSGPIWLDSVSCNREEENLLHCSHNGIGITGYGCDHFDHVGVQCPVSSVEISCNNGDIRLANGSTENEGRVEVCYNNQWGSVCDDLWSNTDARVVCRQLGYPAPGAKGLRNSFFGGGNGVIFLDNVGCTGNESALINCTHLGIGVHNCDHTKDAGVRCLVPTNCTNGEVRLMFGANKTEGTVEICLKKLWGTICDTSWGSREAKVVCQQLGFLSYGSAQINAYYGRGSGPIWLDHLHCNGTESSLLQCPHDGIGVAAYYCDHSDDVGVRCFVRRNSNCSDGEIRLRDGSNEREGRVEICIEETWGTICDRFWDSRDADVVCSQLGFPTLGAIPFFNSYFGSESGPIWLDSVSCKGEEENLLHCSHNGIGVTGYGCDHFDHVGVQCPVSSVGISCNNGDIRLANGSTKNEGRVEVCYNNQWGSVCDDLWSNTDARVVCRQLGYPAPGAKGLQNSFFGGGNGGIFLDNVGCTGSESALINCTHSGIGVHNCDHTVDAGVRCLVPTNCTNGEVRLMFGANKTEGTVEICLNKLWGTICDTSWGSREAKVVCQQLGFLSYANAKINSYYGHGSGPIWLDDLHCNGTESSLLQCPHNGIGVVSYYCDHSDDAGVKCFVPTNCTNGEVRLMFGANETEGTVEICLNKVWGTICDTSWGSREAKVVCQQLGFSSYANAKINSYYGRGSGPIWLDDLHCDGTESSLLQCPHDGIGVASYYCDHHDDAGVRCFGECPGFTCSNSQCLSLTKMCNGVDNCGDGSDEEGCCTSNEFQCDNYQCVRGTDKCDRTDDCGDNSDERGCVDLSSILKGCLGGLIPVIVIFIFLRVVCHTCKHARCLQLLNTTVPYETPVTTTVSGQGSDQPHTTNQFELQPGPQESPPQLNTTGSNTSHATQATTMTATASDQGPDQSPDFNTDPQESPPPYPGTLPGVNTALREPPPPYPWTLPGVNTALREPPPPYPGTLPDL